MKRLLEEGNRLAGWCETAVKGSLLFAITGVAFAAEPDPVATVAELSAAYAKLDGFTATYRSEGEGKSLECTMGMDEVSGLFALHMVAKKAGREMETRQWNTPNDQLFVSDGGHLSLFKGMEEEIKSLSDLEKVLGVSPEKSQREKSLKFTPSMLLTATGVQVGFQFFNKDSPFWTSEIEGAPIKQSDEKTVTFSTQEFGFLTISRENGLLIEQSVTGNDGEVRILKISNLQLNSGKEGVTKISAEWSGAGAVESPIVGRMALLRLLAFQKIIDSAEAGQADTSKLYELLEEQYESLRHFAKACIDLSAGTTASKFDWQELFTKVKELARKQWLQDTPGADSTDEEAFLKYLQKPEVRLKLRDSLVRAVVALDKASERAMDDIFGRGGWASLKVGNDRGVAAKKSIVKALSRAYWEALIDLKMAKQWDQRDGLD